MPHSEKNPHSVLHFATELTGGAGIAALRLHRALREQNYDSHLIYARGTCDAEASTRFDPTSSFLDKLADKVAWHRLRPGSSYFSRSRRFSRRIPNELTSARLVHLHWIAKWLDWESFFNAIPKTTPIVLSLHDASFFTGGCHQPDGCNRYLHSCGTCPKLRLAWPLDPSHTGFRIRQHIYRDRHLTVIPNSHWTASLAQRAALFRHAHILEPIAPGIDTRVFRPLDRATCRNILQLPHNRIILCAGGADWGDANKGFPLLLQALGELPREVQQRTCLLAYGSGHLPARIGQIPVRHLGYIASEHLLALAYSAADLYCTPSLMETFGMTAVEAMACGLPVLAFQTGGLAEIVTSEKNGWLIPEVGSVHHLIQALIEALSTPPQHLASLAANARICSKRFRIEDTAASFREIYSQISVRNPRP
jgi:glycosyltransferase involved in cell wall biosynthesis